jgi:hypothetical protein
VNKRRQKISDYETVTRSRKHDAAHVVTVEEPINSNRRRALTSSVTTFAVPTAPIIDSQTTLRRGHVFSFVFLFLFTLVLYARPAEFYPSAVTNSLALMVGLVALATFVSTQLMIDGTLTARPVEVNLVLVFMLTGLLSIPLAIDPGVAWHEFSGAFIRCIAIFVVIVNVVRSERRLKVLMFLALATGIWLSAGAINDYRLGLMTVEGYRAGGRGEGIFGNSNDMALFLVTLIPLAIVFVMQSQKALWKVLFGGAAILMTVGIVLTYSRSGFIGLLVSTGFLAWKLGEKKRIEILIGGGVLVAIVLALSPSYAVRLASIVMPSLDPVGSSEAREGELFRSLYVAIRHPLLGIGMGNYAPEMSTRGLVTHNSYTQVASEMGAAALVFYTLFLVTPLRKLAQIARDTCGAKADSPFYYLAVGLQASLIGYMVSSFFASVAYLWYAYYLVAYAVCFRRIYESTTGKEVIIEKHKQSGESAAASIPESQAATI